MRNDDVRNGQLVDIFGQETLWHVQMILLSLIQDSINTNCIWQEDRPRR